jgi:hypothetical protein
MSAEKQVKSGESVKERTPHEIKVRLLEKRLSVAGLGRALRPRRPRSTVSQAIHQKRFPNVRKQIESKLWP